MGTGKHVVTTCLGPPLTPVQVHNLDICRSTPHGERSMTSTFEWVRDQKKPFELCNIVFVKLLKAIALHYNGKANDTNALFYAITVLHSNIHKS